MVTFLLGSGPMRTKAVCLALGALLAVALSLSCARRARGRLDSTEQARTSVTQPLPAQSPKASSEKPEAPLGPMPSGLTQFPRWLVEEKLLRSTPAAAPAETAKPTVAILLPPERRNAHLRACAVLAARLGQLEQFSDSDCRLSLLDDGPELRRGNGVIVGRRDELIAVPLPQPIIEKLAALSAGQGLLADFTFGPRPRRWVLVSGADDTGLEKAVLTLGHSSALANAPPSPAVIDVEPVAPAEEAGAAAEEITGLHQAQQAFTQDKFLRQAAFLVPSAASLVELRSLFTLATHLGRVVPSSPVLWPEACAYSRSEAPPTERLKGRSVLLLGSVAQWKAALPTLPSLPVQGIEGETEWVALEEHRCRIADFEPSLIVLQLVPSPWSSRRSLIVAGGWRNWASPTLTRVFVDPKSSERLSGQFAAVDSLGRIATYDTRQSGGETFGERLQNAFATKRSGKETKPVALAPAPKKENVAATADTRPPGRETTPGQPNPSFIGGEDECGRRFGEEKPVASRDHGPTHFSGPGLHCRLWLIDRRTRRSIL
jgi:hypothetical protein